MTSITPLHDRVVVQRLDEETKTAGGIIIPDSAQEKSSRAKVVAVGKGARKEDGSVVPLDVKAGDVVLLAKWGGTELKINGQEYIIVKESDILGIVNEKQAA